MMEVDEEEVPSLVDLADGASTAQSDSSPAAQLQDLSLSKVPLTIVTGWLIARPSL